MKIKTSKLTDLALDWAMHVSLGASHLGQPANSSLAKEFAIMHGNDPDLQYSTNWSQGGLIIERERFAVKPWGTGWVVASVNRSILHHGPTPLVAAMRCYVASKLGDEVEIPKELT